jgi:lipoprotein-anchoring transpeptidase ErfK/SrfK
MSKSIVCSLVLACLAVGAPAIRAQSTQPAQSTQSTQATPSSASNQMQQPANAQQTTDKKVWTNDDVGDLRDHAPISTIGNSNPKPTKPVVKPTNTAQPSKAKEKWYVDQISALQAKIPPLNEKIQTLQAALNGDQVDAPRQYGWVKPDDWRDQLQRLQKQRDDLQAKISALEDQARHDGVPPNVLPH